MEKKILLIGAPSDANGRIAKVYVAPSLGLYRLQYFVQKNKAHCDIYDPDIETIEDFLRNATLSYDILGISGTHYSMDACLDIVNSIKKAQGNDPLLIAGGYIPTYTPAVWIDAGFDLVVLGYGEGPLEEILAMDIQELKNDPYSLLKDVKGVAFQHNDRYVINYSEKISSEKFHELTYINTLEYSIPYKKYWSFNEKIIDAFQSKMFFFSLKTTGMFTASHCPNRCGFCNGKFLQSAQNSHAKLYSLSADEIVDLVQHDYNAHKMDHVAFKDDDFLFSKKRATEFCQRILSLKKENILPASLKFSCQSRVENFLEKGETNIPLIDLLTETGFQSITIGAESCLPHLLQTPIMNKNNYTADNVLDITNALSKRGVTTGVNFMLLIPESTKDDIIDELYIILKLLEADIEIRANVKVMAFPGAPAMDNSKYSFEYTHVYSKLSGKTLELPLYFLPLDADVLDIYHKCEQQIAHEKERVTQRHHMRGSAMRSSLYGICRCLALAALTGEETLYKKFDTVAAKWFSSFLAAEQG